MKLIGLGHSSYLLEMASRQGGRAVRILADPWLSDVLIGDLLGRFPRLRYQVSDLEPLDGIFLSHSHTDHLDPYTLVRLWNELAAKPRLLLPQSLAFLGELFEEFLTGCEIVWLEDERSVSLGGLDLMAFFNPETRPTNEDDVMVLTADNGRELFLCEADATLPLYDAGARTFVSSLLHRPGYETACFLTIKNEGAATMAMLSARDVEDRKRRIAQCMERTYEEIWETYCEAGVDTDADAQAEDLWQNSRLVRLIAGQGICFPQSVCPEWNRVLFPLRLADRVRMEREIAEQASCAHSIDELVAGFAHTLSDGQLSSREAVSSIELLDSERDRDFELELQVSHEFPVAPLRDESRPRDLQKDRIERLLNGRFLPHFIGARRPPVEHLLAEDAGEYRIRLRYGTTAVWEDLDYLLSFRRLVFEESPPAGVAAEFYWANDLEDVLDGRADEFSTFARTPLGGSNLFLWNTLGLPYLNNDLIERKLRRHFERAARGDSIEEWVLRFHRH